MNAGQLVIAYHGCDITTRDDLIARRIKHLDHSANRYDWLGPGAYFFENDLERAVMFAKASCDNPGKLYTARPIATPAVVGAVLMIQRWLDMTTQAGITEYVNALQGYEESAAKTGAETPVNAESGPDDSDVLLRNLDNAVFSYLHEVRETRKMPDFQAVRSAFPQGKKVAPKSGFHLSSHIQIALRDNECVVGWFLPKGAELLTETQYADAMSRLDLAKASRRKPRIRAS